VSLQAVLDIKLVLIVSKIVVNIFAQIRSYIDILSLEIVVDLSTEHSAWMVHSVHAKTI